MASKKKFGRGNEPDFRIGVGSSEEGVVLFITDPVTGDPKPLFRVEPEFARRLAESLTLRSFECEDERKRQGG